MRAYYTDLSDTNAANGFVRGRVRSGQSLTKVEVRSPINALPLSSDSNIMMVC